MSFLHMNNAFGVRMATVHTENHLTSSSHMDKMPLGK